MTKDHIVFVYGTLRRGEHNAHLLKTSKWLGPAVTAGSSYQMTRYGTVPFVSDGGYHRVRGELWSVDDATFRRLDHLEGHPHNYRRIERWFRPVVGTQLGAAVRGWVYLTRPSYYSYSNKVAPDSRGLLRCPTRLELQATGEFHR